MLSSGRKISPPGGCGSELHSPGRSPGVALPLSRPTRTDAAGEDAVPCGWRATPEGFGEPSSGSRLTRRRAGVVAVPVCGVRERRPQLGCRHRRPAVAQRDPTARRRRGNFSGGNHQGEPSGYQTGAGADSSAARQSQGRPSGLTRSPGTFVSCCAPPLPCCSVSTGTRTCRAVAGRPVARLLAVTADGSASSTGAECERPCRAQHLRPFADGPARLSRQWAGQSL